MSAVQTSDNNEMRMQPENQTMNFQQSEMECLRCHQQFSENNRPIGTTIGLFHLQCLYCDICRMQTTSGLYIVGNIFACVVDYLAYYKKCPKCEQLIYQNQTYIRYKNYNYHSTCFKCETCSIVLEPGTRFHMSEQNKLSCEAHFITQMMDRLNNSRTNVNNDNAPRVRRTTFTDEQLKIMRDMFQQCDKPTAYQLDMIAMMTNLKRRTVQVWFQNQRAKRRRRGISQQENET